MGSARYGTYEIGTLWIFHTDAEEHGFGKMRGYQETELTYARSGYAWHRAASGEYFIPHGQMADWDKGNLQCASAPIYLDDEIRYYYAGTDMFHQSHWELEPQVAGLGMASMKPDRFVSLRANADQAELLTCAFVLPGTEIFVNAATDGNGWVRVEMLDDQAKLMDGFSEADSVPITGDSSAHMVRWRGDKGLAGKEGKPVRLRILAQNARIYSIYAGKRGEELAYHRFSAVKP